MERMYKIKKGSILIYGLVIMAAVSIVLVSLLQFVSSQIKNSFWQEARNNSFQIAEAGVYFYKWYLAHELDGKTAQQVKDFWQNGSPYGVGSPYEVEYSDPSSGPIGRYSIEVDPPESTSTIVLVRATGWTYKYPNIKRTIQVRFRRPSWSEFAILGNERLRFGAGTNVYGQIHVNGGIHFDGIAYNKVVSGVEEYYDDDYDVGAMMPGVWTAQPDEDAVFLAGKDFPVPTKNFNSVTADLSLMKTEAQSGNGLYFGNSAVTRSECQDVCTSWWHGWVGLWCTNYEEQCDDVNYNTVGYHVILKSDGTFDVKKVLSYDNAFVYNIFRQLVSNPKFDIKDEDDTQNYSYPDSGLVFFEKPIWVEGQINGQRLTIVSANLTGSGSDTDIYIEHDIKYTNSDGTDIIGLIAQNDITLGYYAENDLEIYAALLAQKGRVGQYHYSGYHKDTVTAYGSMATNKRYGFAYTDGTGYVTRNLYYDNNLLYWPPPFFPTGTEYSLDLWEEL